MKKNKTFIFVYLFQISVLFYLFYITSKTLKPFADEYVSLTSNLGFFTSLDFDAGIDHGGSYGVELTSGPISAIGGVLGLTIFKDLITARFLNFIWVFLLQSSLVFLIKKYYDINLKVLLILSSLTFMLIPWYFGVLYSIGEIASTYLFFYSILIFPQNRSLALIFISTSIFFGKFILVILFSVFYLTYIIQNKQFKYVIKDGFTFSIPLFIWLFLVFLFYEKGNVVDYIINFFNFNFTNNRSAGIDRDSTNISSYLLSYRDTEVIYWNSADVLRVLISPIMFNLGILYFKTSLPNQLKKLILPIVLSTTVHYLWFWLMSPTKWIRYSQHFLMVSILFIFFIFSLSKNELVDKRFYLYFSLYISIFLNSVFLLAGLVMFSILNFVSKNNFYKTSSSSLLLLFLLFNSLNGIYETTSKSTYEFSFKECLEDIRSTDCWHEYENQ